MVLVLSCKKECRFKNLPDIECDQNFSLISDAHSFYKIWWPEEGSDYEPTFYQIDSQLHYDSVFNGSDLLGSIDFTVTTLLGISAKLNPGSEIAQQIYVCKDETANIIRLTAEYSLKDQCNGSGIYTINASFWATIPKIQNGEAVEYGLTDINPYNP